jgi:hypothetical protein
VKTTSVGHAAQVLGMTAGVVRGLLATGYLQGEKIDRVWHISLESLQGFQAMIRSPQRSSGPFLSTLKDQSAIASHLCPVCASERWAPSRQGSEWTHEFMECPDCAFSLHTSFMTQKESEKVSQRIADHIQTLQSIVRKGEAARDCLLRRAQALIP